MQKFELGQTVMTIGVNEYVKENRLWSELNTIMNRYVIGDWGAVDNEDWATNDRAVDDGSRILAAYTLGGRKIWVITEAEYNGVRSATTVLFPEEY